MDPFFPSQSDNEAFEAFKAQVIDRTAHGWVPDDAIMLRDFVTGIPVDQSATQADWDYEEFVGADEAVVEPSHPWEG